MQGENMGDKCPYDCKEMKDVLDCQSEIKKTLPKKVGWKALTGTTLSLLVIIAMFILHGMDVSAKANDERKENAKQIEVVKKDIEHIKDSVKKIESKQMSPEQFFELIKRAVREAD
ncbi:MAG TPA: hypothetical protein VMW34_00330 [Anaerolineales bacterium]|nr:hypothetical protein [Anaerolineales bacterium]